MAAAAVPSSLTHPHLHAQQHQAQQQAPEHGLTYSSDFLTSLRVLSGSSSPPPTPSSSSSTSSSLPAVRALSAAQFAALHTRYVTTHAPDSALFPFLHGLEGDNDVQNAFFCSNNNSNGQAGKARVPRFRGLVWVASDEDEVEEYERAVRARQRAASASSSASTSSAHNSVSVPLDTHSLADEFEDDDAEGDEEEEEEEEEDGYSTSSLDDDDFGGMQMDIDDHVDVVGMDVDGLHARSGEGLGDHGEGAHMHPVVHAHRPTLGAIDTGDKLEHSHTHTHAHAHGAHRLSSASSTSSFHSSSGSTSASPSPPPSSTLATPPTPPTSLPGTPALPYAPTVEKRKVPERVTLTSTFKPRELLCIDRGTGETRFVEPRVPEGISLRNFGIQVPIFATVSDVVVYSPRGNTQAALAVASHFAHAIESKRRQRAARGQTDLLHYNVFVLQATPEDMVRELPHVVARTADEVVGSGAHTAGTDALTESVTHSAETRPLTSGQERQLRKANTISFAQREKDEMRELTQASEIVTLPVGDDEERREFSGSATSGKWDPRKGQLFLGNANDVPVPTPPPVMRRGQVPSMHEEWEYKSNDPAMGLGFDICIECDDMSPFPTTAHMRAAEDHIARLERRWAEQCLKEMEEAAPGGRVDPSREIPVRPPPSAGLVLHLPFPSSVSYAGNSILPFVSWLEGLMRPVDQPLTVGGLRERKEREAEARRVVAVGPTPRRSTNAATVGHAAGYAFGVPSSLPPPTSFPTSFLPAAGSSPAATVSAYTRMRSASATHLSTLLPLPPVRTRPLKILVYSADGYTESSSLALCVLMALRRLSLPEAYLELQLEKRRSFFVYQGELTSLRRVEARLERDRMVDLGSGYGPGVGVVTRTGRPAAASVSFASTSAPTSFLASPRPADALAKRPRASTLPPPPSMGTVVSDHQLWFNDARFDGSFPSRVLPFLYLGNLNHAANAYMLHALGITHVVSVGECALIPPGNAGESCGYSTTTAKPGSLWIEEKEGRIKVLDIKGVSDDGIDSLEPQLPPICEWIDEARRSGGKVLVHCRVGVSRSATVTIAYVMKHLNIPLVDAYLIVRSRRLSVLIQPNMRLLYNLIGWEVRLAQERAGGDQDRLHEELARCLNWPYLAKEVHTLNEKYLH